METKVQSNETKTRSKKKLKVNESPVELEIVKIKYTDSEQRKQREQERPNADHNIYSEGGDSVEIVEIPVEPQFQSERRNRRTPYKHGKCKKKTMQCAMCNTYFVQINQTTERMTK